MYITSREIVFQFHLNGAYFEARTEEPRHAYKLARAECTKLAIDADKIRYVGTCRKTVTLHTVG